MNAARLVVFAMLAAITAKPVAAQDGPVQVNVDNFVRAVSDEYIRDWAKQNFGKFFHYPGPTPIDGQVVERMQCDTIYSMAVFDLTEPVTITVPNAGDRFLSLMTVNRPLHPPDHPREYTLSKENVGTRYVYVVFRIFGNPNDANDLAKVKALQQQIKWVQVSPGKLELSTYDQESLKGMMAIVKQLALPTPAPCSERKRTSIPCVI
jgi:Protein of unknown function (DUF1254)